MDDRTRFLAIPVGVGIIIGIVVGAIVGGGMAIGLGIAVGIVVGAAVGGLLRAAGKRTTPKIAARLDAREHPVCDIAPQR